MVATKGQIELVDRRLGPTGDAVPVRDVLQMRVRPDGSVLKIDGAAGTEIIELGGSALVEQRWDVDEFALVNTGDGRAASVNAKTGAVVELDLASGERTELSLVDTDGTSLTIAAAAPVPEGLRTFTAERAVVTRWDDGGDLIDRISAGSDERFTSEGGLFGERQGVTMIRRDDGTTEVALVALEADLSVLMHVDAPDVTAAAPAPDDGELLLISGNGGTVRSACR